MQTVLVVDDERIMRTSLRGLLSAEGYAVQVATDGDDALSKIAAKRPDLVLLDVSMPRQNGFSVCETIRKRYADLPVIFLTASCSEIDEVRGLGLGADDWIRKDTERTVLLARIRRALARLEVMGASAPARIRLGSVEIDFDLMELRSEGQVLDRITRTETDILRLLTSERDRHWSNVEIVEALRGKGFACEDSLVYTHLSRIRRKLGIEGRRIQCDRRSGYRIVF